MGEYQKARVTFVQTVAELAHRPQNIEALQNAGVMQLLRPLLLDTVASIQQSAALALGRLANYSEELAEAVVLHEILPQLVHSLSQQNRFYKKAAAFVLRAVAKHSPQLAQAVVESGALVDLVSCLEEFDPSVKEAAAWALGYIARHTKELAQTVVDQGAVPLLVLCFQEPELALKKISASALSDICKHSPELAQTVVDAGAVSLLAKDISHVDAPLKRQVCSCLAQIAKHSVDLAEVVVEAEIFPRILHCLKDIDEYVRKNAATCIREIARHTPDLAKLIVNAGGVAAMVDYITEARGNNRLPGIMTLGYIAAFSETLALAVVVSKGIPPLKDALINEPEDHLKAAAAWSLGQIGRHTPDHARLGRGRLPPPPPRGLPAHRFQRRLEDEGEARSEVGDPEVHALAGLGAPSPGVAGEHPQVRRAAVRESPAARQRGSTLLPVWRPAKDPGVQDRSWLE